MMSKVRRVSALSPTLVSIAVAACFVAGVAHANPTGPSVVAGQASFNSAGSSLTIANTPGAIINWQGFSIGTGELTRFVQQSASSTVLNRVVGQDPSAILGTLTSNGKVFLVNPNGILFGQGSRIDVAGLVASTLNISDQDFLLGRLNFQAGATAGSIVNQGDIVTGSGGRVLLLAPDVQNAGLISTPQGEVVLAAGKSVQLVEADLPQLKVEVQSGGEALNVGSILAEGGKIGVYAGLINQRGVVRADSASVDATGRIVFKASDTTILDDGSVTSAAGAKGGEIQILGNKVGLVGTALVDASGDAGGGTVLVGGDLHGANLGLQNAWRTYFGPDATIKADANVSGDGGKVVVWSDDATRAYGAISARGGAQGGNGGLVETSGHYLDVTRAADVGATNGAGGTWLLDPFDVTISTASDLNSSNTGSGSYFNYTATASPSVVSVSTILTALASGGNVNVSTSGSGTDQGNITVSSPISTTQTTSASLTLNATNNIQANADILLGSNVNLYLYAGNSIATANLSGNYVYASASSGSIATGTVSAGSSGVSMNSSGALQPGVITSGGNVSLTSSADAVTVPAITASGGSIYVSSFNDLSLGTALSSPYGVTLQVTRPGGVLTMLSGSSITGNTQGYGYTTSLIADDMVLGGSVNQGSNGYVNVNPYSYGRDINIGSGTTTGALNLTLGELATITTGTLSVGNYYYYNRGGTTSVTTAITPTDLSAGQLNLYGNNIAASADISINGNLSLQANNNLSAANLTSGGNLNLSASYGNISTSNLSAGGYVSASAGGSIATGTVSGGSSGVSMSSSGALQPGVITSGGNVNLTSSADAVTVPAIAASGGSIYVSSFNDLSLGAALSSPYGVTVQVNRPGGVLTMLSGSSVTGNTLGYGYTTYLTADDMVLGGSVNQGSNGYVNVNPYSYGRDINIGSGTTTGALNLTLGELATIATGTLNVGNNYYYNRGGTTSVTTAITPTDLSAGQLYLYGNNIAASADISINGNLSLQANNNLSAGNLTSGGSLYLSSSYGNISTSNLSGGTYVNAYAGGAIATGTVSAGSSGVYMSATGALQPGTITSTGSVQLTSSADGVTVPSITASSGSIYVNSFNDLSLGTALSSPYGVTLQVTRPGGVLTMLSGSSVTGNTLGYGYTTYLTADDMVLGGSVNQGSNGYVNVNPYSNGRDINIGSGTVAGALNLTLGELATITTSTLSVGNNYYYNRGSTTSVTTAITPTDLSTGQLYLYGNNIAASADISINGDLHLTANNNLTATSLSSGGYLYLNASYGNISTGNLSGGSYVNASAGGSITTGTVSAGSSGVYMSATGALQPGTITSAGSVQLTSSADGVTVPSITASSGSIYVNSFNDLSLGTALSSPYGVTLQVTRPGGVLTMLSSSAVNGNTQGYGYSTSLTADDMVLGGSVNQGTNGDVYLNPYSYGRDINIGTSTTSGALNLTPTELATITSGNLNVGNSAYYHGSTLTVSGSVSATDINASTLNLAGSNIAIGANIGVNGSLGVFAANNIDANSTPSALTLAARNNLNLSASAGRIYASGSGATQLSAANVSQNAPLGINLDGSVVASDVTVSVPSGDYSFTQRLIGNTVNLTVSAGAITNSNGLSNDVTANTLNMSATNGIGSGNPIQTAVNVLNATSSGAGNIQINNIGNLTASLTQTGTGGVSLSNGGHLVANQISVASGDVTLNVNGRISVPNGITTTGNINLTGLGSIAAGNLSSGNSLYLYTSGGGISTGALNSGSGDINLNAPDSLQLGAVNATGNVSLSSSAGGVALGNVTTTGGSINITSFGDFSLATALSSPYGVTLQVNRPGGVLTLLSGSSITGNTQSYGNTTSLTADDMVLGGSVNQGSNGYVYLNPRSAGRDTNIGTSTVTGALNLTPTELSTITAGTLVIGNNYYSYGGNATVSSALAATDVNAGTLYLYGDNITASADISINGNLNLQANNNLSAGSLTSGGNLYVNASYGNVSTGNLTGGSYVNASAGGTIAIGTVSAGSSGVYMSSAGAMQPGTITSTGSVQLTSGAGGVTVPNITTTSGSIYVSSFNDLSLGTALSSPYGVTVQVNRPGGVLTMLSGSSITGNTQGYGYSTSLIADDMVLGGSVNQGSNGYVALNLHSAGRDTNIGTSTVSGALNLTPTELSTITTGTLYIGNNYYYYGGNTTVSSALVATDINAGTLYLYGNNIAASADISINGNLSFQANNNLSAANLTSGGNLNLNTSYGNVATGTLSSGGYIYVNAGGAVSTGTVNAANSYVSAYARGALQPGTITSAGNVNLTSSSGAVTVPDITTTAGSININSFSDLSLGTALSSPYGVTLQVTRPGGVLTMLSGSSVTGNTLGYGYTTYLTADDMVLGGSVNQGSNGYVNIGPYSYGRDINIGSGTVAGALNLTPAELSTITTGTLSIGNNYYYYGGNTTVSSALAATDIKAGTLDLYGNNVALGAGISVSGNLGIYANVDIDANTTSSSLDLFAGGNATLNASYGRIFRSGTGVTNVTASSTNIYAPLGVDLGGSIGSADVNITWTSGDYQIGTLTANNVTLNVTNGGIVDSNGTALNITANSLTLNASNGIGSGKAIDTAVSTLTATSGGSSDIQISNSGNLTVSSVTHTGTGNIVLTNTGSLTLNAASTAGGSFSATATGSIVTGGNIAAPSVQLASGGTITQSSGIISNGTLPAILATSSVGGTSLTGNNLVSTFSATNTGGGDISLYSAAPTLAITGISQSGGGGVAIRADDMDLSGPISAGSGLISLAPFTNTSDMYVGNVTGTGLQISTAEIQQIGSTNVELGRSDGSGNLNISLGPTNIVTGSLRLLAGGSVNIAGGPYTLQGGLLQMPGTTNVQGGTSVVVQSGTLDASGGTVNLNGTMQTTGGTVNAGTVNVGGTLDASGGTLSAGAVNILSGGLLMGSGTVTANVTNSGTVAPGASPGLLTISGNYVQTSTGTLAVEIAGTTPGTQYDQLLVSGSVTLGGTLTTTLIGYTPLPGDSFTFVDSTGTITGTFATIVQPASLQAPVSAISPVSGTSQITVAATGTLPAPPSVVIVTQGEITTSTLPQQENLQTELTKEVDQIQSLVVEPVGPSNEEEGLAKKKPACS